MLANMQLIFYNYVNYKKEEYYVNLFIFVYIFKLLLYIYNVNNINNKYFFFYIYFKFISYTNYVLQFLE